MGGGDLARVEPSLGMPHSLLVTGTVTTCRQLKPISSSRHTPHTYRHTPDTSSFQMDSKPSALPTAPAVSLQASPTPRARAAVNRPAAQGSAGSSRISLAARKLGPPKNRSAVRVSPASCQQCLAMVYNRNLLTLACTDPNEAVHRVLRTAGRHTEQHTDWSICQPRKGRIIRVGGLAAQESLPLAAGGRQPSQPHGCQWVVPAPAVPSKGTCVMTWSNWRPERPAPKDSPITDTSSACQRRRWRQ